MRWVKKPFIVIILAVSLVLSGCSASESPSAEIVGEWECEDFILDACAGDVDGWPYLFLLTQEMPGFPSEATLRVLDMDDPANPVEIASQEAPMEVTYPLCGLVLSGNELHIGLTGSDETALWVVGVTAPESPSEILLQEEEFPMWRAWVSGHTLAVATALRRHFAFFDISRPTEPRLLGQLELTPRPVSASNWHADYVGSVFYVVDKDGLAIVDASSPAMPLEVGFYENLDWEPEEPEGVEGAGTTVIYSTEDFGSLEEFFEDMFNSGCFVDVAVSDGYAYIAAADSGLVVLDVSDPESVEEVARLSLSGKAMRVLVAGDLAYIMGVSYTGGSTANSFRYSVHIADISNPLAPELLDSIEVVDTFPPFQSMVAIGDYIYFIDYQTVYVIDIYGGCR